MASRSDVVSVDAMNKYMDTNAFLSSMGLSGDETKYGNRNAEHRHRSYSTYMSYEIIDSVEDSLVEEDLIPVVRCKDCKYRYCGKCMKPENVGTYRDEEAYDTPCYIYVEEDHFCSYGERKEQ